MLIFWLVVVLLAISVYLMGIIVVYTASDNLLVALTWPISIPGGLIIGFLMYAMTMNLRSSDDQDTTEN